MDARTFAREMKAAIEEVKNSGVESIACEKLLKYLSNTETDSLPEPDLDKYKAQLVDWTEQCRQFREHDHQKEIEMFRSVLSSGQGAIKAGFLLNGGATIALLAFIGHLAQADPAKVAVFGGCLIWFAGGVFAAALLSGAVYVNQLLYSGHAAWCRCLGYAAHVICFVVALASYAFFLVGVGATYSSFLAYTQH